MSSTQWDIDIIGKPSKILEVLDTAVLSSSWAVMQSYRGAVPAIRAVIEQNVWWNEPTLRVKAQRWIEYTTRR